MSKTTQWFYSQTVNCKKQFHTRIKIELRAMLDSVWTEFRWLCEQR